MIRQETLPRIFIVMAWPRPARRARGQVGLAPVGDRQPIHPDDPVLAGPDGVAAVGGDGFRGWGRVPPLDSMSPCGQERRALSIQCGPRRPLQSVTLFTPTTRNNARLAQIRSRDGKNKSPSLWAFVVSYQVKEHKKYTQNDAEHESIHVG